MFRRDAGLFVRSLVSLLLVGTILAVGCFGACSLLIDSEKSAGRTITIAVCNEDSDSLLGSLALSIAFHQDWVSDFIKPVMCGTEEEALYAIRNGAAAAIVIPEGFFSGVTAGRSQKCRLIMSDAADNARPALEACFTAFSHLLTSSTQAVFAGDYLMADQKADQKTAADFNRYMNLAVVSALSQASETYFTVSQLAYTADGLGLAQHYAALYAAFLCSVLTICLYRLYQTDCLRQRLTLLFSFGVTRRGFIFWKLVLPVLMNLALASAGLAFLFLSDQAVMGTAAVPAGGVLAGLLSTAFPSSLSIAASPENFFCAAAGLAFVSVLWSFVSVALGEISGILVFSANFVSLFLLGGIIPYAGLLPAVQVIGRFTPLGVCYTLLSPLFGGRVSRFYWVMTGILLPAYMALGTWLYLWRMSRLLTGTEPA